MFLELRAKYFRCGGEARSERVEACDLRQLFSLFFPPSSLPTNDTIASSRRIDVEILIPFLDSKRLNHWRLLIDHNSGPGTTN